MRSVRVRLVFFGTLMMIVALMIVGVLFDRNVRSSRTRDLQRSAEAKLDAMCDLVKTGDVPRPLPSDRDSLLLVQVLSTDGSVVGSTANVMDMTQAFIAPQDYPTVRDVAEKWRASIDGKSYLLLGRRVTATNSADAVYVAAPYSDVDRLSSSLRRQMLLWAPLIALTLALGLYVLVGLVLRPVDTMRRQLDAIESSDLGRRVTEPGTKDEVGRLADTMNRLLGRLQRSADQQARFVSDASHELRTPLAVSRTRLEVGLRRPEGTDWPRTANVLLDQNQRMERLVSDLLLLAKGGQPVDRRTTVDLDEIIAEVVRNHRLVHASGTISFDVSRVSAGRLHADPEELRRVVTNLIDNAHRHANSRVLVSLRAQGGQVELAIEDDGPGISDEDRERVFEPFTRLDASRAAQSGGAGLGLSIVQEIVARHGGAICFAPPRLLSGARVEVRLPSGE
jgi:signal transduction histidine kinase